MNVLLSGSNGFIGSHLKKYLTVKGFNVKCIKTENFSENDEKFLEHFNGIDVVINLSGANIAHRWTDRYKKCIYSSRIDTTKKIVGALSKIQNKPSAFISMSAIGIYPKYENKQSDGNELFNRTPNIKSLFKNKFLENNEKAKIKLNMAEASTENERNYGNDFLARVCIDWENEARAAEKFNIRTVVFRSGVVLGKDGGIISKILPAFKYGAGCVIGSGRQPFSWICIEDLLAAFELAINNITMAGAYNLVTPLPVTNLEFSETLGELLNKPVYFKIPEILLRAVFAEGADTLTCGQLVLPERLLNINFIFKYPDIKTALEYVLN
ncbi:MAG: DUF1731 domain-containing protein [Candidatus Wallbacteria bacterium]